MYTEERAFQFNQWESEQPSQWLRHFSRTLKNEQAFNKQRRKVIHMKEQLGEKSLRYVNTGVYRKQVLFIVWLDYQIHKERVKM